MQFLTSKIFISSIIVLLLATLIWFLGATFNWATDIRLVAIVVLLIVALVVLAVKSSQANKFSDAIEQSIKKQAEKQKMGLRPDRQGKIDDLQQKLEEAIEYLKNSKLGNGKRSKAALYALPWYVFIGPPASGKTTAIKNSGLNNNREELHSVKGVGGTRKL